MTERGTSGGMEITSTDLFDRLTAILSRLATGKKHDPSWIRPMPMTYEERRSDYYQAEAIIDELRKRSNAHPHGTAAPAGTVQGDVVQEDCP